MVNKKLYKSHSRQDIIRAMKLRIMNCFSHIKEIYN